MAVLALLPVPAQPLPSKPLPSKPLPPKPEPLAIYHAFQVPLKALIPQVCALGKAGYSHVQLSPLQRSNPGPQWWKRYQPIDSTVIEGLGGEAELQTLTQRAHGCGVKVLADVVFNHMANLSGGDEVEDLGAFPGLGAADFRTPPEAPGRRPCADSNGDGAANGYADGNRQRELFCWLGGLPDLRFTERVRARQRAHLQRLLDLGVDGFRFDAAKHLEAAVLADHLAFIARRSGGRAWSYLEVIEDADTRAEDYNQLAPVTDFVLYHSLRRAFGWGGDLRSLPPAAVNDRRSVSFARNHDTIAALRDDPRTALDPWSDVGDAWLAAAVALGREAGTPLIFGDDHRRSAVIRSGVRFRRAIHERARAGANVSEQFLRVIDSPLLAMIERGAEGLVLINKGTAAIDQPVLDLSLTRLEGCYLALDPPLAVAIERRGDGHKYVSRWGSWRRGGIRLEGRQALFLLRQPFSQCQT
jgi:alpha-amylase